MTTFIHLTPEKKVKNILRSGIKTDIVYDKNINKGVFCMPLTQDYFANYQWLRELKRKEQNHFIAIHFKIPDDEEVWYGHYANREERVKVKASEAFKLMMNEEDKQGIEVIISRKINKNEILRSVKVNKNAGWRYYPGSHKRKLCKCGGCISTRDFKGKKLIRDEYLNILKNLQKSKEASKIIEHLSNIKEFICHNKKSYSSINHFIPYTKHEEKRVRLFTLELISQFFNHLNTTSKIQQEMCNDIDSEIRFEAAKQLINYDKEKYDNIYKLFIFDEEVKAKLETLYKEILDFDDDEEYQDDF